MGRVGSGRVQEFRKISGSGRVGSGHAFTGSGRVGSGPKIWTRVQLWCAQLTRDLFAIAKFVVHAYLFSFSFRSFILP